MSENPFKDSGLGMMQLGRVEDDATGNIFKDSGLGAIGIGRGEAGDGTGNLYKDSGLGMMQLGADDVLGNRGENQLQFIVQNVNELLKREYTLITFSKLKEKELLQVLNDVFAVLSPKEQVDVSTEDPQATLARMGAFLTGTLAYRVQNPQDFQQKFIAGDEDLLHGIFFWILKRMPENRERVYLARYLVPVDVPDDLKQTDDGVRDVFQQYQDLMREFTERHRAVRNLKKSASAQQLTKETAALQQEKEQLKGVIKEVQKKLSRLPNVENLKKAAKALRAEDVKHKTLSRTIKEQDDARQSAENRLRQAKERLREVQRDYGEMNVDKMIKSMQEDIALNKTLMGDKLPKEIADYQQKVIALNSVLSEDLDTDQLQREVYQLQKNQEDIEKRATPQMSAEDEGNVKIFKQQISVLNQRKEKMQQELAKLRDQKAQLDDQYKGKEAEMGQYKTTNVPRGQAFQQYASSLRQKSQKYKQMRGELQDLQGELGILRRTEQLLEQQNEEVGAQLSDLERERGVAGHRQMQDDVVNLAQTKKEADEAKHQTLEELSKVVQQFVGNIRDRRNKLAPQILDLRNTRQKAQTVEQEWQQKKEIYETNSHELETEMSKLQTEADEFAEECRAGESLYHRLHCQILLAEVANKRVQDERDFKSGSRKLGERFKSHAEMFDLHYSQLERLSRELREAKKDIEENHEGNLQQNQWYKNLKRLLDCKLAYYKRGNLDQRGQLAGVDMTGLGGGGIGVDRLVM